MAFIFKNKKETKWESQEEKFAELALDIYETDKELVIVSPVAGTREEDLDVSLEKDMLVIKGKRQDPLAGDGGNKKYISQECFWGNFMKRI
ncbi:MAG TPA: Hsp20/alpha crystallin family protein, partial [Candidatus Pacearchaeota archaeon]|nr:Hsp20/alpha crystallin family protein [Candidatus Pacearchaeota archaeon]